MSQHIPPMQFPESLQSGKGPNTQEGREAMVTPKATCVKCKRELHHQSHFIHAFKEGDTYMFVNLTRSNLVDVCSYGTK